MGTETRRLSVVRKSSFPLPQPSMVKPAARYAAIDSLGRGKRLANYDRQANGGGRART